MLKNMETVALATLERFEFCFVEPASLRWNTEDFKLMLCDKTELLLGMQAFIIMNSVPLTAG